MSAPLDIERQQQLQAPQNRPLRKWSRAPAGSRERADFGFHYAGRSGRSGVEFIQSCARWKSSWM